MTALVLLLPLWFFSFPDAFASVATDALGQYSGNVCGGGLAPGWFCTLTGAGGASTVVGKITGFIFGIAAAVAVCVFIYASIQMIAAHGQDDKLAAAKKMALLALVGLFLALGAVGIVRYVGIFTQQAAPGGPALPPL